jgi:hypothetical protein
MRATAERDSIREREMHSARVRRRTFFARLAALSAGGFFLRDSLRRFLDRTDRAGIREETAVNVRINPMAVPRTSKGSTLNG